MSAWDDFDAERDLTLELHLAVPRELVFRCWTEPELMTRWFTPAPWKTPEADVDLRPGGRQRVVMAGPDGEPVELEGTFLEVRAPGRLVVIGHTGLPQFATPFMVSVPTFDAAADGGTRYRAKIRHWDRAARETHAAMGAEEGWTAAARQLERLASTFTA